VAVVRDLMSDTRRTVFDCAAGLDGGFGWRDLECAVSGDHVQAVLREFCELGLLRRELGPRPAGGGRPGWRYWLTAVGEAVA